MQEVWTWWVGKLDRERDRICYSLSKNKTMWEVWTQQTGKHDSERGQICGSLSENKQKTKKQGERCEHSKWVKLTERGVESATAYQKTKQQQCDGCEHNKWINRKRKVTTQPQTKMYNPKFSGESGLYPRQEKRVVSGAPPGAPHQEDILLKWRLQRKLEAAREGRYIAPGPATSGAPITRAEVPRFLP